MKKRLLMILLVVALLVTAAVFAVQANGTGTSTNANKCPCGAATCTLTLDDYTGWTALDASTTVVDGGHYYAKDTTITRTAKLTIQSKTVVILLDNAELTCTAANFALQVNKASGGANPKAYIIGKNGAKLTGKGINNYDASGVSGSLIHAGAGQLYLNGDLTIQRRSDSTSKAVKGSVIYATAPVTVDGAKLYGSELTGTADTNKGGAVYLSGQYATLTMKSGEIHGISAYRGGAVYVAGGELDLQGGTIYGGTVSNYGGAVFVESGSLKVSQPNTSVQTSISGGTATRGGAIYVNGGTINISGGTISGGEANRGGNIYCGVGFSMSGGTIENGETPNTSGQHEYGGNIFLAAGGTITGGTISDGSVTQEGASQANQGGNIHLYSGTLSISDTAAVTSISGGSARIGGNISMAGGTCTVNLTKATSGITGGTASSNGGTFYVDNASAVVDVDNGTITGGTAGSNGGTIYIKNGTLDMDGGIITGGTASSNGGNIYLAGGTNHSITGGTVKDGTANAAGNIQTAVSLELDGCTISGGKSTGAGGQMIITGGTTTMKGDALIDGGVRAGATFTELNAGGVGGMAYISGGSTVFDMQDGTIQNCAAGGHGGVANVTGGATFKMSGDAQIIVSNRNLEKQAGIVADASSVQMTGGTIQGLGNNSNSSYALYLGNNSTLSLSGNATVIDAGDTLRKNVNLISGSVTIADGWSGLASIQFPAAAFTDGAAPGAVIDTTFATATAYTGTLYAENVYVSSRGLTPQVLVNNGQLQVAATYIQDAPNREGIHWYPNNAAAVAAYKEGDLLNLVTTEALDLAGKELYVDFGGLTVEVTGDGKLFGIDTKTGFSGEAAASLASTSTVTPEPFAVNPMNDNITYVALNGHFYPIALGIDGVGLHPANVAVYFEANVLYHPDIAECIGAYGLAATASPDKGISSNFRHESHVVFTASEGAPNGAINGYVEGIPNDPVQCAATIKAAVFVALSNGGEVRYILSDQEETSLQNVMTAINEVWNEDGKLSTEQKDAVWELYNAYNNVTKDWNLNYIRDYKNNN